MCFLSRILLICLLIALTIASTIPSRLVPRDRKTTVEDHLDINDYWTNFAPDWPTCANDITIQDCVGEGTIAKHVAVRPDCDNAIEYICTAVGAMTLRQPQYQDMTSLTRFSDSCAARILFPSGKLDKPIDKTLCISAFQSIAELCMLTDGSAGKNYASVGQQAGVMNIFHQFTGSPGSKWRASTAWGAMPGYILGPLDYWGPIHAADAASIAKNGSFSQWGRNYDALGMWWH